MVDYLKSHSKMKEKVRNRGRRRMIGGKRKTGLIYLFIFLCHYDKMPEIGNLKKKKGY